MDKYIKPRYLFNIYEEYVNDKNKSFKYGNFNKIIDGYKSFINRVNKAIDGREKTGYIIINKDLMIEEFTNKHYWCNYDDVIIEEIKEENKQEIKEEEESKKLMEEINKISNDMHKDIDDYIINLNNKNNKEIKKQPEQTLEERKMEVWSDGTRKFYGVIGVKRSEIIGDDFY